jgi:Flp pilus assembly pilin Flp
MQTLFVWITVSLSGMRERLSSEKGQDLIEYALLGGLIAAAVIAVVALGTMTNAVTAMGDGISACIDFKKSTPCGPF